MALIVLITTIYLAYTGYSFYYTPLEERFYHPHYNWFKSSGIYGQGLGVLGTFFIFFGVTKLKISKASKFFNCREAKLHIFIFLIQCCKKIKKIVHSLNKFFKIK